MRARFASSSCSSRRIAYVVQSAYDPTTGLLTRAAFEQRVLAQLAAAGAEAQHCVVYADVDRLHVVNENHGMHVGDEVIVTIAEVIRANLGANVSASRISGDRFALFFLDTASDNAAAAGRAAVRRHPGIEFNHDDQTRAAVDQLRPGALCRTRVIRCHTRSRPPKLPAKRRKIGAAAGSSVITTPTAASCVADEDVAIARLAARSHRPRSFPNGCAAHRCSLGDAASRAASSLLLRMIDATGERVTPDKFLSAAERYQLTTDIDRWVVQYALEVLSSAAPALLRLDAHFTINISGQSLG